MSFVVKAHSSSDMQREASKLLGIVQHSEVIVKVREVRSQKLEEHYHLSPPSTAEVTDDTL